VIVEVLNCEKENLEKKVGNVHSIFNMLKGKSSYFQMLENYFEEVIIYMYSYF
jgi:hypothetical protein